MERDEIGDIAKKLIQIRVHVATRRTKNRMVHTGDIYFSHTQQFEHRQVFRMGRQHFIAGPYDTQFPSILLFHYVLKCCSHFVIKAGSPAPSPYSKVPGYRKVRKKRSGKPGITFSSP